MCTVTGERSPDKSRPRPGSRPEPAKGGEDGVLLVPALGLRVAPRAARRAEPVLDVDEPGVDLPVAVGGLRDARALPGGVEELRDPVRRAGGVLRVGVP